MVLVAWVSSAVRLTNLAVPASFAPDKLISTGCGVDEALTSFRYRRFLAASSGDGVEELGTGAFQRGFERVVAEVLREHHLRVVG